ncbi:MAG: hypothetical protein IKA26_01935 [Alistipes sp.]|nr:hypothetical protein [Alistipes sp.]
MKNLFKFLLAVVALAVVGCTTDTTEDLAVEIGNGNGSTAVTISLEQSRTQLGEKVEGVYPLYWSKGDAIAINGAASAPLGDSNDGSAAATFSFDGEVVYPYNIVYPAPSEDAYIITETQKQTVKEIDPETGKEVEVKKDVEVEVPLYPVTFAAKQNYVEGSFDNGVAPMYGYAKEATLGEGEELVPIQLKHLAGALRFSVKGLNNEVLSKMVITSHTDGLAGTFYIRCSNGTLVEKEGSTTNQIEVSFGEGLALKADEATDIFVAVPAGSYGAITATLTTTDSKSMVVKFSTYGEKAFKAGTVREFAEFTFAENSSEATEEGVFEIYTVADLQKFAKIAPVFAPRTEAKLMADIDMTGVEWTPIDGFIHTLNGNTKSIKGLSAPLFGTCEAKVYDLNLTDVAIELGNNLHTGALANIINNGAVVNCTASGSLIYHQAAPSGVAVGGLVGKVNGCEFSKNTNRVDITIVGEMSEDILNDYILRVGGLAATLENPVGKMEKSYNYGTINITKDIDRTSIGGLIGFVDAALHMDDCHNHGKMILAANIQGDSFCTFAGIAGSIDAGFNTVNPTFTVTNCSNNGAIIFGEEGGEDVIPTVGKTVYYTHIGGMFGYTRDTEKDYYDVKLENCTNNGNIDVNAVSAGAHVKLGGIFTQITTDLTMTNCHNNGKIGFTRSVTDGASGTMYIGGLIAHIVGSNGETSLFSLINCSNKGELYTSKNIYNKGILYTGGVAGYVSATSHLSLTNFSNSGALNFANKIMDSNIYIGSLSGYLAGDELTVSGFTNDGDITADVTLDELSNNTYIGGIIGHNGSKKNNKFENVVNNGDITATGASNRFMFAGIVASIAYDMTLDSCQNTGVLTLENKQTFNPKHLWYGGIMACILDSTNNRTATLNSCTNSGDITLKNTNVTEMLGVAGIAGQLVYATNNTYYGTVVATDCVNEGDILVQNSTAGVDTAIGGIVSATTIGANKDGKTLLYNPTQKGNITVQHTGTDTSVHLDVGGLVGIFVQGEITKNAAGTRGSVSGNFKIDSNNASGPQWRCIGGVAGEVRGNGKISDIDVLASGDNSMTINLSTMKGNVFLGGVVGYCPSACEFSNITNSMPLNAKAETSTSGTIYAGGIAAYIPAEKTASFSNITNNGDITTDSGNSANGTYVGGGFGNVKSQITATDITNNGDISVTASTKMANVLSLGGIVGQNDTAHGNYTNLTNNGNLTVKKGGGSYKGIYLGGIAGGQPGGEDATHTHFNCVNNGDITLEKGIESAANIRVGGCLAWVKAGYCDKLKNTGDIYMHANTKAGNYQLLLGGVFSYNASTLATNCAGENGGYINTGNILVTVGTPGSTNSFATTIGGVCGAHNGNLKNAINTGNITFTGDYGTANSSIGGIIGYGSGQGTVENCKQYGDILVYPEKTPTDTKYAAVTGMIAGSTRIEAVGKSTARTAVVRNCYLGGRVAVNCVTGTDANGDETTLPDWKNITAGNFSEFIYRGMNGTEADGCQHLTAAPTLPW